MSNYVYKFRLYPNEKQIQVLNQMCGNTRFVWNKLLEFQKSHYDKTKKDTGKGQFIFASGNKKPDTDSKCQNDPNVYLQPWIYKLQSKYPFLNECHQQSLNRVLRQMKDALKGIGKNGKGFPRFKNRFGKNSFYVQAQGGIKFHGTGSSKSYRIRLPKKLGLVKIKKHRDIFGKIISYTVSGDKVGNWFISILVDQSGINTNTKISKQEKIGIDKGARENSNNTLTVSYDGKREEDLGIPKMSKSEQRKRKILSRRLSRKIGGSKKVKPSNNQKRAKLKLAMLDRKIAQKRLDWVEKTTNELSKYSKIYYEDAKTSNLGKKKKGAGKGGRTRNRNLYFSNWFMIENKLKYKADRNGNKFHKVPAAYTSQTCSNCGHIDKISRNQKEYDCVNCGFKFDADFNAARNILNQGIKLYP